jgi:hypothetical protein
MAMVRVSISSAEAAVRGRMARRTAAIIQIHLFAFMGIPPFLIKPYKKHSGMKVVDYDSV